MKRCSAGFDHDALVASEYLWRTLRFVGFQHDYDEQGNEIANAIELRNCACGSTLARDNNSNSKEN